MFCDNNGIKLEKTEKYPEIPKYWEAEQHTSKYLMGKSRNQKAFLHIIMKC